MNELWCVTLRKVDPSKNMARQYSVAVCRDLFGTPVVVCRWGRIGRAGRSNQHVCGSLEKAQVLAEELVARRRHRGYGEADADAACSSVQPLERSHASVVVQASAPPRQRAKNPVIGQLWLLDWPAARLPRLSEHQRPQAEATAGQGAPADYYALMRRLEKPATHEERERAMSILTLAASLRGITLSRGSVRPSASA